MKAKVFVSFLVMITCEATTFAQTESPDPFQIRMQNYCIGKHLEEINSPT